MSVRAAGRESGSAPLETLHCESEPTGLEIRDLTITYDTESGPLDTVRNVSLDVSPGEIYGLVGESGSGKTTLARAIVQYLAENGSIKGGSVVLDGVDLLRLISLRCGGSGDPESQWCIRIPFDR